MTRQHFQFYCSLCDREFKDKSAFGADLHIRRLHSAKIIEDAVRQYTKAIFEDLR